VPGLEHELRARVDMTMIRRWRPSLLLSQLSTITGSGWSATRSPPQIRCRPANPRSCSTSSTAAAARAVRGP
jgi:hypothetical protein